jgi:endonuclease YncB( thermonuclease family)
LKRSSKKRPLSHTWYPFLVVSLLITLLILWQRQRAWLSPATKAPYQTSNQRASTQQQWVTLSDCHLLPARSNDGDSFLVQHEDKQHTFRLYFVDCPEKEFNNFNQKRLADQAEYFKLLTPQAASQVGQAAAEFTHDLLKRPFTIITKWERVYDSKRFYAQTIVRMEDGTQKDLSELLIKHGYARIFTKGTHLLGHASEADFSKHLRTLEAACKAERRGAWNH